MHWFLLPRTVLLHSSHFCLLLNFLSASPCVTLVAMGKTHLKLHGGRKKTPKVLSHVPYRVTNLKPPCVTFTFRNCKRRGCWLHIEGIHCLSYIWTTEKVPFDIFYKVQRIYRTKDNNMIDVLFMVPFAVEEWQRSTDKAVFGIKIRVIQKWIQGIHQSRALVAAVRYWIGDFR